MGRWFSDDGQQFHLGRTIKDAAYVFVALAIVFNIYAIVPSGYKGVLVSLGKVENTQIAEGWAFKIPFIQAIIPVSIQTQKYEASASAASKDLQIVSTKVALNFHLDSTRVNEIYQKYTMDYGNTIIAPAIQESVKASTAQYAAEKLITNRALVKDAIEDSLKTRLSNYGIIVETISITDFDFSPEFNAAIEAKVTAEQNALKAENDLKRIKIEAEQRVTQATAEAEAIKIQAQALLQNSQLIQLEWVKKWDGHMPTTVLGGNTGVLFQLPVS